MCHSRRVPNVEAECAGGKILLLFEVCFRGVSCMCLPISTVIQIISSASASEKDGLLNIKAFYPESFDRIILDPPCSALGLRPKLQIDATAVTDLEKHVRYQRLFVREAVSLLKPGGTMTFSTCTIHAAENEGMVRYILDEHSNMSLVPIDVDFGLPGLPGFGLSEAEQQCVRRFDPSDVACDTMGFFVAKFVKKL
jgi:16S rRNA C967 or C1407 C5-methylase (RsmB/RsmF family)